MYLGKGIEQKLKLYKREKKNDGREQNCKKENSDSKKIKRNLEQEEGEMMEEREKKKTN